MDPSLSEESWGPRKPRQHLREWLEEQINSEKYPGLLWIERERRIFQMPWKHNGRADWQEEDGLIFKAWAVHNGRYREGTGSVDFPTWKHRLNNAINRHYGIRRCQEYICDKDTSPYRIYQFADKKGKTGGGPSNASERRSPQSVSDEDTVDFTDASPCRAASPVSQFNIPTLVKETLYSEATAEQAEDHWDDQVQSLDSDLKGISIQELVPKTENLPPDLSVDSSIGSFPVAMDTDSMKNAENLAAIQQATAKQEPVATPVEPIFYRTPVGDHVMTVTLRYKSEIIQQVNITNPHGCRVFFGDLPYHQFWNPQVYGNSGADQIAVQYKPGHLKGKQDQSTQKLLTKLELGISIFLDQSDIYVIRRCKPKVTIATSSQEVTKLIRQKVFKVFDFRQNFLHALLKYQHGEGPRPQPQAILAVGQDIRSEVDPYPDLLFTVTVCHGQASDLLAQYVPDPESVEMSVSNSCDHYMANVKAYNATYTVSSLMPSQEAGQETLGVM